MSRDRNRTEIAKPRRKTGGAFVGVAKRKGSDQYFCSGAYFSCSASSAPPGQSLAFSLGDEKGFEWIGAYDITADELLARTDTTKTESKTAQAQMLILELLADGKRMPSAELEKAVNERGISSRTMRTAKSRIGDRLVTEKDGTAWVCYLRD